MNSEDFYKYLQKNNLYDVVDFVKNIESTYGISYAIGSVGETTPMPVPIVAENAYDLIKDHRDYVNMYFGSGDTSVLTHEIPGGSLSGSSWVKLGPKLFDGKDYAFSHWKMKMTRQGTGTELSEWSSSFGITNTVSQHDPEWENGVSLLCYQGTFPYYGPLAAYNNQIQETWWLGCGMYSYYPPTLYVEDSGYEPQKDKIWPYQNTLTNTLWRYYFFADRRKKRLYFLLDRSGYSYPPAVIDLHLPLDSETRICIGVGLMKNDSDGLHNTMENFPTNFEDSNVKNWLSSIIL